MVEFFIPYSLLTQTAMPYTYYINALILTVGGAVFWACPPRQINEFYGYRTIRSRKSQEAWDFAQKYSAKMMTVLGLVALAVASISHWLRSRLCLNSEYVMLYDIGITAVLVVMVVIPSIVMTEIKLRKRFG